MNTIGHWIGGRAVAGTSGRTAPVFDPARGVQTGEVALASAAEVDDVVKVAVDASVDWGASPLEPAAPGCCSACASCSTRHRDELAAVITREHGKVLDDARGEVARGLECVEFACGIPHLLKGAHSSEVSRGVDVHTVLQPVGVVAGITPFNFPVMVPLWMLANALACGNAFVLKPSEKDPSASLLLAELVQRAGFPDGVFNVVQGDAEAVDALLTHPDVDAVSFVGSTAGRPTRLRDRHARTASGSRRSAGRRTTWSCSPTPTSTPPPTPRSPRPTARPASAAWRSRSSSRSGRSPTRWSTPSRPGSPTSSSDPATTPPSMMGPLITARAPRPRPVLRRSARADEGATVVVDGTAARRSATASSSGVR